MPGINIAGKGEYNPWAIRSVGFDWVRLVAFPDFDQAPYLRHLQAAGLRVFCALCRESFPTDDFAKHIRDYERLAAFVDAWGLGNEADQRSPSSWSMPGFLLNDLIVHARRELGPLAHLVGPSMVSGDVAWMAREGVRTELLDGIAVHPYGQRPSQDWPSDDWGFGIAKDLVQRYAGLYQKPVWVTEFGLSTVTDGIGDEFQGEYYARMFQALKGVAAQTFAFCWSDGMVPGFGIVDARGAPKAACSALQTLFGGQIVAEPTPEPTPESVPVEDPLPGPAPAADPQFVLGFADWAALEPDLIGTPTEDEFGFAPGVSIQATSEGILFWVNGAGFGFKRWHDRALFRWAPDWAKSELVAA